MSKFAKSTLTVDGNHVQMSMPFTKVDKDKRLVSGWATLDNLDTQGDIVLAEASKKAFARARGNIREMHQPIAVGKIVDFREKEYFDDGEFYRGIFVTAYVSKGAEDTWEKVLDGTLTGFSIGGEIIEASNEFVKDANRSVRFIHEYDLTELSLVDNPANQKANIESIQKNVFTIDKSAGSVRGMVADTVIENVFVCSRHNEQGAIIVVNKSETDNCPLCGEKMENAGWFEAGADRAEKVQNIVSKFLDFAEKEAAPISESEGGVEVGTVNKGVPEGKEVSSPNPHEAQEAGDEDAVATVEEEAEQVDENEVVGEEESEPVQPVEVDDDEESQISKKIDEMAEGLKTAVETSQAETLKKVSELEGQITKVREEFLAEVQELNEKISGATESIDAQKNRLSRLESSVEKFNSSGALKKSADLEPAEPVVQKQTFWNGAFSGRSE